MPPSNDPQHAPVPPQPGDRTRLAFKARFASWARGLMTAWRQAGPSVLIALLAYRYAFLIGDELRRLRTALRVRGFRPTMNRHGYRTLGHVTGAVLVRGADRAERVSDAMRCRGFDGRFHTLAAFRTTPADVVSFLLTLAAIAALLLWDRS